MKIFLFRFAILFYVFTCVNPLKAQTPAFLDEKLSIKNFKLGAPWSDYSASLRFIKNEENGTTRYKYKKRDVKEFYSARIGKIEVTYYKSQLSSVKFFMKKMDSDQKKALIESLKELCGSATFSCNTDCESVGKVKMQERMNWKGEKASLWIDIPYPDVKSNAFRDLFIPPTTTTITFRNVVIDRSILQDQF